MEHTKKERNAWTIPLKQALAEPHQHQCKRCNFIYFCKSSDPFQCQEIEQHSVLGRIVVLKNYFTDGRCPFCRKLNKTQCSELTKKENYLGYHFGLYGKRGYMVAQVLDIDKSKVQEFY